MTAITTGGTKDDKSHLAESLLGGFSRKIYIATMQPYGEEAHAAIERHRRIRSGKGFETIEKYTDIDETELPRDCSILLECMANLCANEMFRYDVINDPTERIMRGIMHLQNCSRELVIVTNNVGSDGIIYSPETEKYIEVMGRVNALTADIADNVVECVYGVPVVLKGKLCC